MKFKKVIIWGYKFGSHTHSYIHSSYNKAFKALGYTTYWFDDSDINRVAYFDFKDTLFFTAGNADNKIPLLSGASYILHNADNKKYLEAGCKVLNMYNYVKYCEEGISFNHKDTGNTVEKISDLLFFDSKAPAMYQPWATDLLPDEINEDDPCLYDASKRDLNYIGSIWSENINQLQPFAKACLDNQISFHSYGGGISDADNKRLVRDSYIAPDIRGEWHKECGYIPCRIFKNLSYGKPTGINSSHVYKIFGDMIAYNEDTYNLFASCEENSKEMTKEKMRDAMLFIKSNHTYINRANNIFNILSRL